MFNNTQIEFYINFVINSNKITTKHNLGDELISWITNFVFFLKKNRIGRIKNAVGLKTKFGCKIRSVERDIKNWYIQNTYNNNYIYSRYIILLGRSN